MAERPCPLWPATLLHIYLEELHTAQLWSHGGFCILLPKPR